MAITPRTERLVPRPFVRQDSDWFVTGMLTNPRAVDFRCRLRRGDTAVR